MVKLDIDSTKKVFLVKASGVLAAQEIQDFIIAFEENIKKIDARQYALIVDAKEQKTIAPDGAPLLEKVLKLYVDTPFKKRFSVVLESAVAMLQVKKVGKDNIDPFTMVTSVEEAYKNI
jgi:hypothetical protein